MCHVQTDQVAIAHAYEKARQARPCKAAPSQPSTPAASPKSAPAALPAPDKSSPSSSSSSSPTQLTITAPSNPMLAIGDLSTATATLVITKEGSASIAIPVSLRKDA
ncbi:hypothetical protein CF327_g2942 [Tilletia walkeri]|nr:hypothetical protein CF327_g2942 [Tilletia walkeri]